MNGHVCSMRRHSCIVLRHLCYVGRHVCSVQRHSCTDTPALCYDTFVTWASMSLFSASALLLVLRHLCYVSRHVPDQCYGTPTSVTALLLREQARIVLRHLCSVLYSTFGYLLCYVPLIHCYWSIQSNIFMIRI